MRYYKIIVVIGSFLFLLACSGKAPVSVQNEISEIPELTDSKTADALFVKAETAFQQDNFTEALDSYQRFVRDYPDDEKYPFAMDRLGDLFMMHGYFLDAASSYDDVITHYPESRQAENSGINYLLSFYNEGRYTDVINQSGRVLSLNIPGFFSSRIYEIAGDAFFALSADLDALTYYLVSYSGNFEENRESLQYKLKNILVSLSSDDVKRFISRTDHLYPFETLLADLVLEKKDVYEFTGDSYVVGCLFPQTGKYSLYGKKAEQSLEFALYQYNLKNEGPEIRFVFEDTGSDSITAINAVRKLAEKGVAAIIGPIGTVEPVVAEANALNIPIIAISGRENIPDIGHYVFRNGMTKKIQAKALCRYAVESAGVTSFAILYPEKAYGTDFMNLFWNEVEQYGGRVVSVESYDSEANDFEEPVKKLAGLYYPIPDHVKELEEAEALLIQILEGKESEEETGKMNMADEEQPDDGTVLDEETSDSEEMTEDPGEEEPQAIVDFQAVFIPDQPAKIGLILPQLKYYDVDNVLLLGTNLWHSDTLLEFAKKDAQDAIVTDSFFSGSDSPHVKQFVDDYQSAYGEGPGYIEAVVYDSANLVIKALKDYEVYSREEFRDALSDIHDYQGVTGKTSFLENGDVDKEIFYLKVYRNRFYEVKPELFDEMSSE